MNPLHFYLTATLVKKFIDGQNVKEFYVEYTGHIKRTKPDLKTVSERLYQKFINHHFTFDEYILYLLNEAIYNPEFFKKPYSWDINNVSDVSKLFTETRRNEDEDFMVSIAKQTGLREIEKYFEINSDGNSFCMSFVMKKLLSPRFFIDKNRPVNYSKESLEHKRFRRIMDGMKQVRNKT